MISGFVGEGISAAMPPWHRWVTKLFSLFSQSLSHHFKKSLLRSFVRWTGYLNSWSGRGSTEQAHNFSCFNHTERNAYTLLPMKPQGRCPAMWQSDWQINSDILLSCSGFDKSLIFEPDGRDHSPMADDEMIPREVLCYHVIDFRASESLIVVSTNS